MGIISLAIQSALFFIYMKLFTLLKEPQNIVDLKNTERNITVTDWEFFSYFSRDNSFNIITLRPTRSYGTTTIQEKTDNKVTET